MINISSVILKKYLVENLSEDSSKSMFSMNGEPYINYDSIDIVIEENSIKANFKYKGEVLAFHTINTNFAYSTIHLDGLEGRIKLILNQV